MGNLERMDRRRNQFVVRRRPQLEEMGLAAVAARQLEPLVPRRLALAQGLAPQLLALVVVELELVPQQLALARRKRS